MQVNVEWFQISQAFALLWFVVVVVVVVIAVVVTIEVAITYAVGFVDKMLIID